MTQESNRPNCDPPPKMEITDMIGSYGPWQRRVFWVFFYVNTVGIWQNLSITFLAPNMDFWCVEPTAASKLNHSSSWDGRCDVQLENASGITVPCTKWEYDTSYFSQTLVSEWDLVCDRMWLVSLAKSVYMVGFLISVILFGQMSDSIGRFPTIVMSYVITCVSMLVSLLSTSYTMFVILRFFQALGRTGLTTIGIVLVMELMGPKHRTEGGIAIQLGWSMGFITLAGVAFFVRHWFWFQLAMAIPLLPLALAYRIIPESPRWLLMRGKLEKLEKVLVNAVEVNKQELKVDIKDTELLKIASQSQVDKSSKTVFHLFKTPKMRMRTLNMIYLWMVNAFMYYGLSFNTNDLAGNPYLNFFLAGALEFPAYAVLFWGIKRFGRRPTLVSLMIAGGVVCASITLVPQSLPGMATSLALLGKFCVTGSFGLLYLYTSEMFPTVVRNVALGSCSMCARVGSILAPFVKELGLATHSSVPNLLYGLLAVSSGLLALLLPETKGRDMPDTLEEGEHFGQMFDKQVGCVANGTTAQVPIDNRT